MKRGTIKNETAIYFKGLIALAVLVAVYFVADTPNNAPAYMKDEPINLTREEIQGLVQELTEEGFLPEPGFYAKPRPYKINGEQIAFNNETINFLIAKDPASPNGTDENDKPIIPQDLTDKQKEIYMDLLYEGTVNWLTIARNPQDSKALGGCIYCNAPGGAGGCYKKRVLRGLVYSLVKENWNKDSILKESDLFMKYLFGNDPFLAWGLYYKKTGRDVNEIHATVDKLSNYGRRFILSQFSSDTQTHLVGSQVCGV